MTVVLPKNKFLPCDYQNDTLEEEEQVFIATAKGRNGRKSPYTQLRATRDSIYFSLIDRTTQKQDD